MTVNNDVTVTLVVILLVVGDDVNDNQGNDVHDDVDNDSSLTLPMSAR